MSLNFTNLVSQGRAKAPGVCWSEEELAALITLEKECGISRLAAADYIRNGIMSVDDFNKAQKVKFVPQTLDEASKEVEENLKARGREAVGKTKKGKK